MGLYRDSIGGLRYLPYENSLFRHYKTYLLRDRTDVLGYFPYMHADMSEKLRQGKAPNKCEHKEVLLLLQRCV